MTDWTSRHYAVVDVEGNGQQPPDLVELAVVPITGGVIGEPVCWLVAHNAAVDVGVLRRHLTGWQCPVMLDTLRAARRLLPGQASYKLGALAAAFSLADGLPAGLSPHRAAYDALVTARLFVHLAASNGDSLLSAGDVGSGGDADAARLF